MGPFLALSMGLKTHLAIHLAWINRVVPTKGGEGQEETGPSALHEEVSREPHIRKHSLQTGPGDHPGKQQAAHSAGTHRDLEIAQEKEMPGVPPTDSPKLSGPRTNRIRDVLTTPE